MEINYIAVVIASVLAMVVGAIWYGPLFGNKWMEVIGATDLDKQKREEMQKGATKLYFVQFLLTLFQVLVLAHLINDTNTVGGLQRALWIWAAFIVPTLAGVAMWNNDSAKIAWSRFLIQGSYQLVIFVIFGLILQYWK
jgi:hypothetical protein